VKDMSDGFKVVSSRYYDKYNHMYKLGKSPSLLKIKMCVVVVANGDESNMLLYQCLITPIMGMCDIWVNTYG
jgi:hypothetical protein